MPKVLGIKLTDSDYERWEDYAGKEPLAKFVRRIVEVELAKQSKPKIGGDDEDWAITAKQAEAWETALAAKVALTKSKPLTKPKGHPSRCSCFECSRLRKLNS